MFDKNGFGIDLGCDTVKIYNRKRNSFLTEKNMIAVRDDSMVVAVGDEAYEIFEKNPPSIAVDRPVRDGRISDPDEVEMVISCLLKKTERSTGSSPDIILSVPVNMSLIEKNAFCGLSRSARLGRPRLSLIEKPVADLIGIGIPIGTTKGSMLVSLGARMTEVTVVAQEQIILTDQIPIGGMTVDEAVCEEIRKQMNLIVGTRTADRLKRAMASFRGDPVDEIRTVCGTDTLTGLPSKADIPAEFISETVQEEIRQIAVSIRSIIMRIPPQIARFIREEGIYLAGGLSRIPGIDRYLSRLIGCKIDLCGCHENSTVNGLREVLGHKELRKWCVNAASLSKENRWR